MVVKDRSCNKSSSTNLQALFYDEKYQEALANLEHCQKFDPSWELSKSKNESTIKFLLSLKEMVTYKGKLKPRKLNGLLKVQSLVMLAGLIVKF